MPTLISTIDKISIRTLVSDEQNNFSLMAGNLSNALLWAQIGLWEDSEEHIEKCFSNIIENMEYVQKHPLTYKLSIGVTGLAWAMQFLANNKVISQNDCESLNEIDDFIIKSLEADKLEMVYDLLVGIIGKGVYLIERNNDKSIAALNDLVDYFENTLTAPEGNGMGWMDYHTSYYDQTERDDLGYYNMGLAHGIPSIIVFLSKLYKMGIKKEKCAELIRKGIGFIMQNTMEEEAAFSYPSKLYPDKGLLKPNPSKVVGWCFGPLSTAVGFLAAYDVLKDQNLYDIAYELTIGVANFEEKDVRKAGNNPNEIDIYLCHGTAGLAYMNYKLNKVFKDSRVAKAVDYWKNLTYEKIARGDKKLKPSGAIEGMTGVCLIMNELESENKTNFEWDKIFLLDQLGK